MIWRDDMLLPFMEKVPASYAVAGGGAGALTTFLAPELIGVATGLVGLVLVVMKTIQEGPRTVRAIRRMWRIFR